VVRIRSLLIACHVVAVSGCAIAQLQQDSGQMTTRIADKEAKLNQLERVDADIQKLQAEARRIENDNRLSEAAKKERVEALRKQIKDYLQVMITQ